MKWEITKCVAICNDNNEINNDKPNLYIDGGTIKKIRAVVYDTFVFTTFKMVHLTLTYFLNCISGPFHFLTILISDPSMR